MTETLTNSGAVKIKAGSGAAVWIINDPSKMTSLINEAEAYLMAETRINWVDQYASLDANKKKVLDNITSDIAAMYVIQSYMGGYTSRQEALIQLNLLWAMSDRAIKNLKDDQVKKSFVGGS